MKIATALIGEAVRIHNSNVSSRIFKRLACIVLVDFITFAMFYILAYRPLFIVSANDSFDHPAYSPAAISFAVIGIIAITIRAAFVFGIIGQLLYTLQKVHTRINRDQKAYHELVAELESLSEKFNRNKNDLLMVLAAFESHRKQKGVDEENHDIANWNFAHNN